MNRAGIYVDQQRSAEALADYQHVIDKDPKLVRAYLGRARVYENSGKFDNALEDLETVKGLDPLNGSAWQRHGEVLRELGRRPEAILSFTRAIELRGNTAFAYFQRALTYFGMAEDRLAIEDASAAIELDSKLVGAYLVRGHARVHLWKSAADYEMLGAAVRDYSRAIELDPTTYAAYVGRGRVLSDNYQEDAAIADFTRAIALNPNDPEAYLQRALAYNDSERYKQARADLKRVLKLDPKSYDAMHALGEAQRFLGKFQDAIAAYTRALALNDGAAEAYAHRAQALLDLGRNKQALEDVNRAIELAPKWAGAYRIRASVYTALRNSQAAAADEANAMMANFHVRSIEFPQSSAPGPEPAAVGHAPDPDDTIPEMEESAGSPGYEERLMRAGALFDQGRYAEAIAVYTELIADGDTSAATYYARGFAKARNRAVQESIDDYTLAIQADPNFAAAYNNRGVAYRSLARTEDAIRDYDRAIALDPSYAMAYINRGGAYVALNDTDQALTDMSKGIELEPRRVEGVCGSGCCLWQVETL